MSETAAAFDRNRYVLLPALLKEPTRTQAYQYACAMADAGTLLSGDDQVPGTPRAYGDFVMEGLLEKLHGDIERASGLKLFPTYSYFRIYKQGDALARHTDRPSCEISVTLCLGFEQHATWPIWIEGPRGSFSANLQPGDALLYRGVECPHWREKFEGRRQAQVFLHYVDQNGRYADWKFDKRSAGVGRRFAARP